MPWRNLLARRLLLSKLRQLLCVYVPLLAVLSQTDLIPLQHLSTTLVLHGMPPLISFNPSRDPSIHQSVQHEMTKGPCDRNLRAAKWMQSASLSLNDQEDYIIYLNGCSQHSNDSVSNLYVCIVMYLLTLSPNDQEDWGKIATSMLRIVSQSSNVLNRCVTSDEAIASKRE